MATKTQPVPAPATAADVVAKARAVATAMDGLAAANRALRGRVGDLEAEVRRLEGQKRAACERLRTVMASIPEA